MAAALTSYLKRHMSARMAAALANAFGVRNGALSPVEHMFRQDKGTLT
jgi:hypothetical protein